MNTKDLYKECVRLCGVLSEDGLVAFTNPVEVKRSSIGSPIRLTLGRVHDNGFLMIFNGNAGWWQEVNGSDLTLLTALHKRLFQMAVAAGKVSKEEQGEYYASQADNQTHNYKFWTGRKGY